MIKPCRKISHPTKNRQQLFRNVGNLKSSMGKFLNGKGLFGVLCVIVLPVVTSQHWDLQGDYCRTRRPETCCKGRHDDCTVPILGTLCYCDTFCNRTGGEDCCPDFWEFCIGIPRPEPLILPQCVYKGKPYLSGQTVHVNCNKCTCRKKTAATYGMVCDEKICLVQPDLVDTINNNDYGWKASNYSFFWGKTLEEGRRYRLGTFKPSRPTMEMNEIHMIMNGHLPREFDARQKWPDLIQPIRDQGDCAASWAFSTTGLASDRLAIQSMGEEKVELSPQQLISCQNRGQRGCHGGHLDRAWWYSRKFGIASEQCYPYQSGATSDEGKCPFKIPYGAGTSVKCHNGFQDMLYRSTPPYRVGPKEEEIRHEIYTNGPVQATFQVKDDFFLYKSGVYRYTRLSDSPPDPFLLHSWHSVRIIGWGEDRSEGQLLKYWLCTNSWGQEWGENGYFRIIRGENECDIETFIVGVWAQRNMFGSAASNEINNGFNLS